MHIPIIVITITAGKFGYFFLQNTKNANQAKNVPKAYIFVLHMFLITSYIFIYISLCFISSAKAGSFRPNAADNCCNAIVIPTAIKNQCNATDGNIVIYFVILRKYTSNAIIPEHIATNGNIYTPVSGLAITNHINIDDNAPATQNIL